MPQDRLKKVCEEIDELSNKLDAMDGEMNEIVWQARFGTPPQDLIQRYLDLRIRLAHKVEEMTCLKDRMEKPDRPT